MGQGSKSFLCCDISPSLLVKIMGHQTQKSIAGMGLFYPPLLSPPPSPPPPPPPPFHGDSPFSIAKGEWDERRAPSEEHEGIKPLNRRLGEEEESERSHGRRVHEAKQPKSSGRGHWRPSEDTKLKELVSQYGPHNWNLIAEKLEGRSGTPFNPSFTSTANRRQKISEFADSFLTLCIIQENWFRFCLFYLSIGKKY